MKEKMDMETVATRPLTREDIENARARLSQQRIPPVKIVLVGSENMRVLNYFAMKYPNGVKIVKKIDKKRVKKKSLSKKRYFVQQITPPISITTYHEQEALMIYGVYHIRSEYLESDGSLVFQQ